MGLLGFVQGHVPCLSFPGSPVKPWYRVRRDQGGEGPGFVHSSWAERPGICCGNEDQDPSCVHQGEHRRGMRHFPALLPKAAPSLQPRPYRPALRALPSPMALPCSVLPSPITMQCPCSVQPLSHPHLPITPSHLPSPSPLPNTPHPPPLPSPPTLPTPLVSLRWGHCPLRPTATRSGLVCRQGPSAHLVGCSTHRAA